MNFIKLFLVTLLIIGSVGCSSIPLTSVNYSSFSDKFTQDDIVTAMHAELGYDLGQRYFSDKYYSIPTEKWIEQDFSKSFKKFLGSINSSKYVLEENDCDKFTLLAFTYVHILHHNTLNKIDQTGISFGEFWYYSEIFKSYHAVNVIIVKRGGINKVIYFDAETQKIITLTDSEKLTCLYWRF
jgi:hypothetical protein